MLKLAILMGLLLADHINVTAQPPTEPNLFYAGCTDFSDSSIGMPAAYDANFKTIVKQLQDQATSTTPLAFYSTSAGSGSNTVYGQYYCRGDIGPLLCGRCIEVAGNRTKDFCKPAQTFTAYYEECTLRIANQSMFRIDARSPNWAVSIRDAVVDPVKFGSVIKSTMDRLITKAAYGNGSVSHFATGEGVVSSSETVYCLVQCSPDLDGTQCENCLRASYDSVPTLKGEWVGSAIVFYPSCQLRYNETAFYMRPNSPSVSPSSELRKKSSSYYVVRAIIPAAVVAFLLLLCVSVCLITKWKMLTRSLPQTQHVKIHITETEAETTECLLFDLKTIEGATNSFSLANKLGEGGFGIVYQGILEDGQDVAIKRLSKYSGQGANEFRTEVEVVAKLQHINLVRLVGCCVDGEERLLVYEFLRNLSLDHFLFDETRSVYLTWAIRHQIIEGIARGLHYLHEGSRMKIVHRDLKTSNILLDDNLDPKIADFGLARPVKMDQTTGNTSKVVGTYGYMAPEYALAGRYSTKSDVYSFGVIVLEVLSGKSNNLFYEMSHGEGLLHYAWRSWNEGVVDQFVDPILQNNYSKTETERCLKLGLLCVQDDAASRPPMRAVLVMLNSNTADLPPPSSPSHSNYISNISSGDGTQEETIKEQEIESGLSSATFSSQMDLNAR